MFEIKKEVVQQILNYLVQQPFGEVYRLVSSLQGLKEIKNETPKVPEVRKTNKGNTAPKVQQEPNN